MFVPKSKRGVGMIKDITVSLKRFVALFRTGSTLPWTILLPLLVVAFLWPVLNGWFRDERATFMVAFVLAMGLRLMLRSDGAIRKMRSQISTRSTFIIALLFGPGVIAFLIWVGEPIWCQRFLSVYFMAMSGLYLLDVIDGRHAMVKYFLPSGRSPGAHGLMSRVMAIFHMAMLLVNETMIAQGSLTIWLVYFGLLPVLSQRVVLALIRTVDEAYAKGYGRG